MSYAKYQMHAFDQVYKTIETKPTVNGEIILDFVSKYTNSSNKVDLILGDIGGGAGANLFQLRRTVENSLKCHTRGSIVCDVSIEGLRRAKSLGLQAVQSSATHVPFSNGVFNMVLSVHVLEHVVDDSRAIQELGRVTRREGILYVGAPNKDSNLYLPLILDQRVLGRNPLHIRSGYDANRLAADFHKLGFRRLLLRYHGLWGAFCVHILRFVVGLLTFMISKCFRLPKGSLFKGRIEDKIENITDRMIALEEKVFGNSNPHSMNFFFFLERKRLK